MGKLILHFLELLACFSSSFFIRLVYSSSRVFLFLHMLSISSIKITWRRSCNHFHINAISYEPSGEPVMTSLRPCKEGYPCPPSEFQSLVCCYFGRFLCHCQNFNKTSIVCHCFIALVSLFQGRVACGTLPLSGPYNSLAPLSLTDWPSLSFASWNNSLINLKRD